MTLRYVYVWHLVPLAYVQIIVGAHCSTDANQLVQLSAMRVQHGEQ